MLNRIIGVFKLDAKTFEEIEHNNSLTLPAAMLVILVSLASGLGSGFVKVLAKDNFFGGFLGGVISVLIGWMLWSFVTLVVGTRIFKGEADLGQMLRVIGFAYVPLVLSIIPCIGGVIGMVWAIAAGFIAIRQGLDLDDLKAFFTIVIGALAYILLSVILYAIF